MADQNELIHAPSTRIGWLQPHLRVAGGIRRAIETSNRLFDRGALVDLITPDGTSEEWLPIRSGVKSVKEAAEESYDVLILSDPDMVDFVDRLSAHQLVVFHLGAYSLYRLEDEALARFYSLLDAKHIANSTWTAEMAERRNPAIEMCGIVPGAVDRQLFRPQAIEPDHDVVFDGSRRMHKGTAVILAAVGARSRLALADQQATQEDLPSYLARGRVYVSAAWHEGFNLGSLEAMACGIPVVMTDDGGSRDYAVDQHNSLIVPRGDIQAISKAVALLSRDRNLRETLVAGGIETGYRHTWDETTTRFIDLVL